MIKKILCAFLTEKEIKQLDINQEYLTQVDVIAQKCNAELNYHQSLLPQHQTPNDESAKIFVACLSYTLKN